jgi:hypothetical protein
VHDPSKKWIASDHGNRGWINRKTASSDDDKDIGMSSASNQDLLADQGRKRDSLKCTEKRRKTE